MKIMTKKSILNSILSGLVLAHLTSRAATVEVQVDQPGHRVAPTLWGIFFEDINLSADGGVYPELVRNRSFEDGDHPEYWKLSGGNGAKGEMHYDSSRPLNPMNRHSLRVSAEGAFVLENEGYFGMNIVKGEAYTFRLAARATNDSAGPLTVRLVSASGQELARGEIAKLSNGWKYYQADLTASGSDPKAKLEIGGAGPTTLFLDMVSLMPKRTWKKTGLRPDLAEAMDGLRPSILRFPGGCWVEGEDMSRMYNWKKTIGDIDTRTPLWNIWGYNATHGLGYHEYLQLTEDLGATPVFCINIGMSHQEVVPMGQMGQWVQDALDAIEYANGPTNSFWGSLRAKHGHPAPFGLKYLEIGNENGGEAYRERWELFVTALRAKYPEVQLIANHWLGGYPEQPAPDLVDEHYYNTPEFFMRQAGRYDNYDRKGPKIFVGEYAVTRNGGKGNLRAAIGEAAFMTGLERNSDVIAMAAYAPLFCNADHKRWPINLINFDSSRWFGLPGYYVQKLFSENRGDVVLPVNVTTDEVAEPPPAGCIGVGTWNTAAEFKDIVVTGTNGAVLFKSDFKQGTTGWKMLGDGNWKVEDGALRQTAEKEFVRAIVGDRTWQDYTITLKARKLSGREGFLILFHINDDEDRTWWNIAGWNNTQHGVELGDTQDSKRGQVEPGRWYDIKIEVRGASVRCSLDGKVIHDIKNSMDRTRGLYASAVHDEKSGDVIVKVVNTAATPTESEIKLAGVRRVSNARAVVLTSENAKDENTLEQPTKVVPRPQPVKGNGPVFKHSFPGNSLTVLRVQAER